MIKEGQTERPTIEDYVDNIDYLAQLLGNTDHIGMGTDNSLGTYPDHKIEPWGAPDYFGPVWDHYHKHITSNVRSPLKYVKGFSAYSKVTNLIELLNQRGHTQQDVKKILGENFLRVFGQVWR